MLKHYHLTEKVIGTFYEVYNDLGFGLLESVYENALRLNLVEIGFDVKRQFSIPVWCLYPRNPRNPRVSAAR